MPKDRFHEYLDYCENVKPVSVGDYIEMVARGEVLAWTYLIRDVKDTFKAGLLKKIPLTDGGAAYVRLSPSDAVCSEKEPHTQEGIAI